MVASQFGARQRSMEEISLRQMRSLLSKNQNCHKKFHFRTVGRRPDTAKISLTDKSLNLG